VETNSILPEEKEFEFLRSRSYSEKRHGFVIKTMKMGGVYSEGIAFTMNQLSRWTAINPNPGFDMTQIIGVKAIEDEVPETLGTVNKKPWLQRKWEFLLYKLFHIKPPSDSREFPSNIISTTDETQAQNLKYIFDPENGILGSNMYATMKMDGMSGTFIRSKGYFIVCTRNRIVYKAKLKKAMKELNPKTADIKNMNQHCFVAAKYNLPYAMKVIDLDITFQGEVCGPSVQRNRIGLKDYELYIFNYYFNDTKQYYPWNSIKSICSAFNIPTVPLIDDKLIFNFKSIEELENYAAQFKYPNGFPAEGVVFRAMPKALVMPDPQRGMHAMLSFKIINPLFKVKTQKEE
jgi:hypothetical protein